MSRSLILIVVLGCGSPKPGVSNTTMEPTPAVTEAPTDPDQPPREEPKDLPCEPRMESWPEGHHDRYLFNVTSGGGGGGGGAVGRIVLEVAAPPSGLRSSPMLVVRTPPGA